MAKWHSTPEYHNWRKKVLERDGHKCLICNSKKDLTAHHLNHGTYFPEERYLLENGITLCEEHHKIFHTSFKRSYRVKCTKEDFAQFVELIMRMKNHGDCDINIAEEEIEKVLKNPGI